jgi:hypothetical protein
MMAQNSVTALRLTPARGVTQQLRNTPPIWRHLSKAFVVVHPDDCTGVLVQRYLAAHWRSLLIRCPSPARFGGAFAQFSIRQFDHSTSRQGSLRISDPHHAQQRSQPIRIEKSGRSFPARATRLYIESTQEIKPLARVSQLANTLALRMVRRSDAGCRHGQRWRHVFGSVCGLACAISRVRVEVRSVQRPVARVRRHKPHSGFDHLTTDVAVLR